MNPTEAYNGRDANRQNAYDSIPWFELFSRHEAVLCSHMEMLSLMKGQAEPDTAALQTISSMVHKTAQAINQLKIARKQMMNKSSNTSSASTSSNPPQTTDTEANMRRKRRRVSREKEPVQPEPEPAEESRSSKRARDASSQSPFEQEGDVTSTSLGTEDISAEVQRRLKIKEEQRRKRETPKQDKRKRDSLASNDGASPSEATCRPRKKRAKMSNERKRGSDSVNEIDTLSKKRRKTP